MDLDPEKFKTDESKSNPMVVAMAHPDCPLSPKEPCVYIVVGPGTIAEQCRFFVSDESQPTAICTQDGATGGLAPPAPEGN